VADIVESSRRIMAAYGVGTADRVPVTSPISWSPFRDIDGENPGGFRADPAFRRIARLVQRWCDPAVPYNHVSWPQVFAPLDYQRFLEAPPEFVEALPRAKVGPARTRTTHVLHTSRRDLTWSYDEDEDIETKWDVKKPVTCPDDVDALLSVPFSFARPADAAYEPFRRHRAEAGGLCIGGAYVNSMVAMLVGVMDYELVLEWVLDRPDLIHRLADAWLERTWSKVDFLLSQGIGPFWHFNGVERASPPMMGRSQWDELVVPYDGEIMRRIKARDPEARIHVHCHGRVSTLLDSWLSLGVDSIDPVEPPPQGDIRIGDARKRVGEKMTLYGNLEFAWMEMESPAEIERHVREAIAEGGKERLVLAPSATPHQRQTAAFTANAERYILAALEAGAR
jgi:hypothetical protein